MENTAENNNNMCSVSSGESAQDAGSTNTGTAKQATGKQLTAIVFILALATKLFLLPIFLIQSTGRDAYIVISIYGGVDLIALGLALAAIKIADCDFFTLLSRTVGKVGAKISVGIIGLFLFFKLNTAIAEILTFYGTNVFTEFNTSLMIIVLLSFLAAAGTHTLRALCRLNELLAPIIVVCLAILVIIVVMTAFDLANIFPAVRRPQSFIDGLLHHTAWLGDFTPLVLFVGRTKMEKRSCVFAATGGVIGTAVGAFFALVMCAAFGNVPVLVDSTTNLSNILQFTVGNVYGRLDMFSSILWSVSVFIESALLFYSASRCVAFVIGKNAHFIISLCLCVAIYVLQVFALVDPMRFSVAVTSETVAIVMPIMTIAVPMFALVCAAVERNRDNKGSAKNEG